LPQRFANNTLGLPFIELQSVGSTNNYALEQVHAGLAQHGTAFFAHEQLAGKGQRGRKWQSGKGENIILTLVIKPFNLPPAQQFQLSAATAVGLYDFFSMYAGDQTRIKWPNDLYWQDRKAGGILIESVIIGDRWEWAVVGIGLNLNQVNFEPGIGNPVSLKQVTGKNFVPVNMSKELCDVLDKRFRQLQNGEVDIILADYSRHLYKLNELVKFKKGTRVFQAMVTGVSPVGRLIVRHAIDEELDFGEVEWVLK
jgi:BirA family biotin operon repressor/biotin-[acetyl-CoA-carboxylase] ligase